MPPDQEKKKCGADSRFSAAMYLWGTASMGTFLSADFLAPDVTSPSRMVDFTPAQRTQMYSCVKHSISHPKCKANQATEVEKFYLVAIFLPKQLSKASQLISAESASKSTRVKVESCVQDLGFVLRNREDL